MLTQASRSFALSALLHAAIGGVLLVLMLRVHPAPNPEPLIIDMGSWPEIRDPSPTLSTRTPGITFTPVKVVVPLQTHEPTAPDSNKPLTPERPQPAQPRVTASRSSENVRPITSRATTITEHRRLHPTQASASSSIRSSAGPAKINMEEVLATARPDTTQAAPSVDGAQAASYWERLVAQLRAVHEKPPGLDDGLQARVEFTIRADGTVADVRILKSSGNDVFDASVVAAFRRLGGLGVPPAGSTGTQQITFRTRAE
jgi:colicin import membrane protein